MFHDEDENRRHYDSVSGEKRALYFQRFDTNILDENPIVADLLSKAFDDLFFQTENCVLDLGCGTAFYYPLLAKHAKQLIGVDVSRKMLGAAKAFLDDRQLSHCHLIQGSAMHLPFPDQSFDVVHCWDFLHHVEKVSETIQEISRVLKPNGRLIAVEPNLVNPSITWYHLRRRSEWRLFWQNQLTIPRLLRSEFEVKVSYDNTIISFLNERTHWIWLAANWLTSIRLFRILSFRYVIEATQRTAR